MKAHELFTPFLPRPDLFVSAAMYRAQIAAVARYVHRAFVTTDSRVGELLPFWRAMGLAGAPGVMRIGSSVAAAQRVRAPGRRRVGVFSTLATNKRFDVVLGAFERVWRRNPESELTLIGDLGPRTDRRTAALHAQIDAHPGRARIRATGKLSLGDVAREMAALDVYLFPMTTGANTRSSTLPLALETGLPVVAIRGVETDPHLFKDGENVVFAADMAGEAFGDAANRILDDAALADRLAAGARRLYEAHLAWPRIGSQLVEAILGPGVVRAAASG
jgi:glycosyltransferase involved in cell wall biosynthesis